MESLKHRSKINQYSAVKALKLTNKEAFDMKKKGYRKHDIAMSYKIQTEWKEYIKCHINQYINKVSNLSQRLKASLYYVHVYSIKQSH